VLAASGDGISPTAFFRCWVLEGRRPSARPAVFSTAEPRHLPAGRPRDSRGLVEKRGIVAHCIPKRPASPGNALSEHPRLFRKRRRSPIPRFRSGGDEVFVKVNGKLCYLSRAIDHEGEVLEAVVTAKRDKAAALKLLKRIMKKYGRPRKIVTDGLCSYPAARREIGNADRQEGGRPPRQQSGGESSSAVSKTRTSDAAIRSLKHCRSSAQFTSRSTTTSVCALELAAIHSQSGTPSRHAEGLRAETLGRIGGVARPFGVNRRFR
jgi:hypothetical protein